MLVGKTLVIIIPSTDNNTFHKITKSYFDSKLKKNKDIVLDIDIMIMKQKNCILSALEYLENNINDYKSCLMIKGDIFLSNIDINNFDYMISAITKNLVNNSKLFGGFEHKNVFDDSILFFNINKIKNKSYFNFLKKTLLNVEEIQDETLLKYMKNDILNVENLYDKNTFYLNANFAEVDKNLFVGFLNDIFNNTIIFYKFTDGYLNNKKILSVEKTHINNCILYSLYSNYKHLKIDYLNRKKENLYYIDILKNIAIKYYEKNYNS